MSTTPIIALALTLMAPAARAGDTWTKIRPGVDYLHRTASDPQDIYAARIDLTVPNVGIHASADAMDTERHVTTSTFASNADVLVAINGDWSDATTPVGLAISDGWLWNTHITNNNVGGQWGFFACTATKTCTIDTELPLDQAWWFGSPTLSPYRYYQAIGANGIPLLVDGVAQSGCYDSIQNPRSAICLDSAGTTLWLVVVDGRSGSADGMTCDETRALLLDLGCWSGGMLDGGGSSTLVIEGVVKNNPSDGYPRTVANHLGIIYSDSLDPACLVNSGRWCTGTTISACQGGRFTGSGDCAYYGASCEEDGDYAYCVDYRCPNGSGSGVQCLDATRFAACTDGQYGEGDCGAFGLLCGSDAGGTSCMDSRCEAGPNSGFCTDAGISASCAAGLYTETDCAASGLVCWAASGTSTCMDSRCPSGPDGRICTKSDVLAGCTGGVYSETDCADQGMVCDVDAGCYPPEVIDTSDTDTPGDTHTDTDVSDTDIHTYDTEGPGLGMRKWPDNSRCGCLAPSSMPPAWTMLIFTVLGMRRRRFGSTP